MISIIIPVYNEEACLKKLLSHLFENAFNKKQLEVIIVDGGSTDDTTKIAKHFPQVNLVNCCRGRASQMNAGAMMAKGEILYFLHADSFPPSNYDRFILEKIVQCQFAGCFQMKFDSNHWWLRLMGWFTKINHKTCRGGDQSLFITKKLFSQIGGFDESFIIYEDNDFIQKLYQQQQFTVIKKWLTTSARKYHEIGVWKLQWIHFNVYLRKWCGASAKELFAYYKKNMADCIK